MSARRWSITGRRRRAGVVLVLFAGLAVKPSLALAQAERWTVSATLRETVTDNLFLTAADGPGESVTGASLSLGYTRVGGRSALGFQGWTSAERYDRFDAYNGARFGLGASEQIRLDRRARLRLGGSYADGLHIEALQTTRIGQPQLDVRTSSATAGLTYQFTPSTAGNASFDSSWIRYRTDVPFDSAQLPGDANTPPDVLAPVLPGPPPDPNDPVPPDGSLEALSLLARERVLTSSLDYWTWRAGVGLVHEFSPRTRVTGGLGYRSTHQTPQTFSDGNLREAQLAFQEVLDTTASLGLSYAYQDSRVQVRLRTHSFTAQADKAFGRRVKADASLGASYLDGQDAFSSSWTFVGGAGLGLAFKRTSLAVRYSRTRYQGVIVGRNQVSDVADASLGHRLARRVRVSVFGSYRNDRDVLDSRYVYDTTLAGASLRVSIKKRSSAGVSYSFLRFHARPSPTVERSAVSVFLAYALTLK